MRAAVARTDSMKRRILVATALLCGVQCTPEEAQPGAHSVAVADGDAGNPEVGGADGAETASCAWTEDGQPLTDQGCAEPGGPTSTAPAPKDTILTGAFDGVRAHENLAYATRGGRVLVGDLYLPPSQATPQKPGVLVVVHGGGFADCKRRRDAVAVYAQAWAKFYGVPTFNIEYRLVEEGGAFPNNVMDVKCAVQWIAQRAADYGVDGTRIGIIGESAGAHLALMTALTRDRADLDPQCSNAAPGVVAAVGVSGVYDLPAFAASASPVASAVNLEARSTCATPLGACGAGRACDRCVDASPTAHACTPSGEVLLVQAQEPNDPIVPLSQASGLYEALVGAGATAALRVTTTQEMTDPSDCPNPKGIAHGFLPCVMRPTNADLFALVKRRLL